MKAAYYTNNNYAILSFSITCEVEAILTSVASYLTTIEYINYLSKVLLKLNIQANSNNDKNILMKDNTNLLFFEYSSNEFKTAVEETYAKQKSLNSEPAIFIYNH